jgi:hypothetical protein
MKTRVIRGRRYELVARTEDAEVWYAPSTLENMMACYRELFTDAYVKSLAARKSPYMSFYNYCR